MNTIGRIRYYIIFMNNESCFSIQKISPCWHACRASFGKQLLFEIFSEYKYEVKSTNNSKKCELCHDHGMSQKIWITKIRYISAYIELDELFWIYCNNLLPMLYINNWNSYTESTYRHYSLFANQNVTGTQTLRLVKQNFSSNLVLSHKHSILSLNVLLSLLLYCVFRMFCGFLPIPTCFITCLTR